MKQKIIQLIAEETYANEAEIRLDMDIRRDLNVSSLEFLDVIMRIEDEFEVSIEESEADAVVTIADLIRLVETKAE